MIDTQKTLLINAVLNYFSSLTPISSDFIVKIKHNALTFEVSKNKHILSPIDENGHVFFVVTGIVRGFIKDGDREITTWISMGNEFISAIQHPDDKEKSSIEYLQALEHTEVVAIPNKLIERLYLECPETNIIGRKILALQYYIASENAILSRIPSAEKRYQKFMEMRPFDINKVPLRCVASYLGMRLETLSRIRTKYYLRDTI